MIISLVNIESSSRGKRSGLLHISEEYCTSLSKFNIKERTFNINAQAHLGARASTKHSSSDDLVRWKSELLNWLKCSRRWISDLIYICFVYLFVFLLNGILGIIVFFQPRSISILLKLHKKTDWEIINNFWQSKSIISQNGLCYRATEPLNPTHIPTLLQSLTSFSTNRYYIYACHSIRM